MKDKIGATGQFPKGKLNKNDEGELQIGMIITNNVIEIHFGKPVSWLGLPLAESKGFYELFGNKIKELENKD